MTATAKAFPDPAGNRDVSRSVKSQGRSMRRRIRWFVVQFLLACLCLNVALVVWLGLKDPQSDAEVVGISLLALGGPLGLLPLVKVLGWFEALGIVGFGFSYAGALLLGQSQFIPLIAVLAHLVLNQHRNWMWEAARAVLTAGAIIAQGVMYLDASIAFSILVVWYSFMQYWYVGSVGGFGILESDRPSQADSNSSDSSGPVRWLVLSADEENTEQIRLEIESARNSVESKRPGLNERLARLRIEFSRLKLAECVGYGSFGEVYRAVLDDGQVVAVKRVPRNQVSHNKIASMFTEIDVVASCTHPNIIKMIGWSDDPYVLVCLEYANGGSLKSFLASSHLQIGWCLTKTKMALDAASGLAYLHNRNILHRDIKVDNFLVCTSGENSIVVKIADFGTSRSNECDLVNNPMTPVGSPLWLAPEVARGTRDYGAKADVWSFGVGLCEIATHSVPYEDLKTNESYFNLIGVSQGKITPQEQLLSAIDLLTHGKRNTTNFGNLCRLVEKCCAFDPEARPSMNGIMFELLQMMVVDEDAMEMEHLQDAGQSEGRLLGEKSTSFSVRRATSLRLTGAAEAHNDDDILGPLNSPSFTKKKGRISDPTSSRRSGKNLNVMFAAEAAPRMLGESASFRSIPLDYQQQSSMLLGDREASKALSEV